MERLNTQLWLTSDSSYQHKENLVGMQEALSLMHHVACAPRYNNQHGSCMKCQPREASSNKTGKYPIMLLERGQLSL
eukprot:1463793-Amphidinium_carterae.1